MLSFSPSTKLEMEMKRLHGLYVESYKSLESISPNEARYLNRFALISNIGASTRIENAVLTDQEIERVDTSLKETQLPRRTVQYGLRTLAKQNFLQLLGKGAGSRYQLVF